MDSNDTAAPVQGLVCGPDGYLAETEPIYRAAYLAAARLWLEDEDAELADALESAHWERERARQAGDRDRMAELRAREQALRNALRLLYTAEDDDHELRDWVAKVEHWAGAGADHEPPPEPMDEDEWEDERVREAFDAERNLWGAFTPPEDDTSDDDLYSVPGFIDAVVGHTMESAAYPNKPLAFAGALALQSYLCGRKVRDPGGVRPNVYLLALANSGVGKEQMRRTNMQVALAAGVDRGVQGRFASAAGLEDGLMDVYKMLLQIDEFDSILSAMLKANDGSGDLMAGALLQFFTESGTRHACRLKANHERRVIDQPHLSILGTCTPQAFYKLASERLLSSGLVPRMLVIEAAPRGEGRDAREHDPPPEVVDVAKHWATMLAGDGNLEAEHPTPRVVLYEPGAGRILADHRLACDEKYTTAEVKADDARMAVLARANELARKLALLYACSTNHQDPVIGVEAAIWATRFADVCTSRLLEMVGRHAAESEFDGLCKKALEKLRRAGGSLSHAKLRRACRVPSKEFGDVVQTLIEQEEIDAIKIGTKGNARIEYRIRGA